MLEIRKRAEMVTDWPLINYGRTGFNPGKFVEIRNCEYSSKPFGGFWASPVNSSYGWADWCRDNEFGNLKCHFTFKLTGKVYTIRREEDVELLPFIRNELCGRGVDFGYLSFEAIKRAGVDAIHLTVEGERETRFPDKGRNSLYGWDCESVLILNEEVVKP